MAIKATDDLAPLVVSKKADTTLVLVAVVGLVGIVLFFSAPTIFSRLQEVQAQNAIFKADCQARAQELLNAMEISKEKAKAEALSVRLKGEIEAAKALTEGLRDKDLYFRWKYLDNLGREGTVVYTPHDQGLPSLLPKSVRQGSSGE